MITTVTLPRPVSSGETRWQPALGVTSPPETIGNHLILDSVSWQTYLRLARAFDDRHLHITYDRGILEIMTLSSSHERLKHLLGYFVGVLVEELGWNMAGFGSMTFKDSRQRRGVEPDECYWIQSEPLVRSKDQIDLRRDPPPDLVIEIDVTHSSLDRLAIYAAFQVPEVWRWSEDQFSLYRLQADGTLVVSQQSRAFPFLDIAAIERFLQTRAQQSETELIRQFRRWVRQQVAQGWA